MARVPLKFELIPVERIPERVRVVIEPPIKFELIPVRLPEIPPYAGRRHEVIFREMEELGFKTVESFQRHLAHEKLTFYDILRATP